MTSDSIAHKPAHDTMVAVAAMGTFQNYLEHADAKVSILSAILAGSAGAMLGADGTSLPFGLVYLIAFFGAGFYLAQALRPRLDDGPATSSPFGIMGITGHLPADTTAQRDAAWAMARILADVAALKYHHVVRAIPWTAACVVLSVTRVFWSALSG